MAVALAAVDVIDVVDVDLTAAADVEDVEMTVVDVVTVSQAQPLSALIWNTAWRSVASIRFRYVWSSNNILSPVT